MNYTSDTKNILTRRADYIIAAPVRDKLLTLLEVSGEHDFDTTRITVSMSRPVEERKWQIIDDRSDLVLSY